MRIFSVSLCCSNFFLILMIKDNQRIKYGKINSIASEGHSIVQDPQYQHSLLYLGYAFSDLSLKQITSHGQMSKQSRQPVHNSSSIFIQTSVFSIFIFKSGLSFLLQSKVTVFSCEKDGCCAFLNFLFRMNKQDNLYRN